MPCTSVRRQSPILWSSHLLLAGVLLASCSGNPAREIDFGRAEKYLRSKILVTETVDFSQGSPGVWLPQDGFGSADQNGTPLRARHGNLIFETNEQPRAISFEILGFHDSNGNPTSITVATTLDERRLDLTGEVQTVSLALDEENSQVINFKCSDASSMLQRNLGEDARPFCAYLLGATITFN